MFECLIRKFESAAFKKFKDYKVPTYKINSNIVFVIITDKYIYMREKEI